MKKETEWARSLASTPSLVLEDGARIGVVGAGPAGSFFTYFLLDLAERTGREIEVDLFETRDFSRPAPQGCNMCGGIVSESLVQTLAADGIDLPPTIVQRGIDSYVMHMDAGTVKIETPLHEMRIGAVYRGSGPRDIKDIRWGSFDGHLQGLARDKGANLRLGRVDQLRFEDGRPQLKVRGGELQTYDLIAVAVGINTGALKLFSEAGIGYEPPKATKTIIREFQLGEDRIGETVGSAMHVFLLDIPRLDFAAIIPKGDYVSVCLLGEDIDDELVNAFFDAPEVREVFPPEWRAEERSCWCVPKIAVSATPRPYADRVVFVGDCAVTRLYKDGIGAAYRTAKAAARTAMFQGVSEEAFRKHYGPICRTIQVDNRFGHVTFFVTHIIQKLRFARRAVLRMTALEQKREGHHRRMSGVLWDMFTGSASYKNVFMRTLHPFFLGRLFWNVVLALTPFGRRKTVG